MNQWVWYLCFATVAQAQTGYLTYATGINPSGIAAADLGNIFDPFYSKSNGRRGTGLGLPLCYAIVKQHAGAIEVESTPGQGSVFTVRLDLSPD